MGPDSGAWTSQRPFWAGTSRDSGTWDPHFEVLRFILYICIYIYIYIYTYICIYIYIYIHTYVYIYIYICVYICYISLYTINLRTTCHAVLLFYRSDGSDVGNPLTLPEPTAPPSLPLAVGSRPAKQYIYIYTYISLSLSLFIYIYIYIYTMLLIKHSIIYYNIM